MNQTAEQIQAAQKIVSSYWPLTAFIAHNHLWHYRDKNFFSLQNEIPVDYLPHDAQSHMHQSAGIEKSTILLYAEQAPEFNFCPLSDFIRDKIYQVLNRYFNQKNRNSLITIWATLDRKNSRDILKIKDPINTINYLIETLNIPSKIRITYFQKIYLNIYGWSAFSEWLSENPNNPWVSKKSVLNEILLMWLFYEHDALIKTGQCYTSELDLPINHTLDQRKNTLAQSEKAYYEPIYQKLLDQVDANRKSSEAQFIFCIDTRSEGIRRQLESTGNYETFGYAGFFGVIFQLISSEGISYQSPALLHPTHTVNTIQQVPRLISRFNHTLDNLSAKIRNHIVSPMALFEIIGVWYLPYMVYKTIFTRFQKSKKTKQIIKLSNDFSIDEKMDACASFLKTINLTHQFSDHVIICGHQTDVTNNPFKSALNCGACGGNAGVTNARLMCDFLNDPAIRKALHENAGIKIPDRTHFYAATHHTVDDRIEFLNTKPTDNILKDCQTACENLKTEKINDYPFLKHPSIKESNWAELVPELGLLNNASFIIGPRALSQNIDLKRRAFLHSYDPTKDDHGDILATIFSGPGIVAHWINMQYFLSTTNPKQFGAGNKAIHNVLPNIGVMEGNLSDLKIGLPLQSIFFEDKRLHQPLRLTYFVFASHEQIQSALEKSVDFALLVKNEWVNLIQIEPVYESYQ